MKIRTTMTKEYKKKHRKAREAERKEILLHFSHPYQIQCTRKKSFGLLESLKESGERIFAMYPKKYVEKKLPAIRESSWHKTTFKKEHMTQWRFYVRTFINKELTMSKFNKHKPNKGGSYVRSKFNKRRCFKAR